MNEPADQPADHPLRVSLTLPGSASLGAFQAGAMAAVAVMITTLRDRGHTVHVDAIGGSSAGSIVSALFAYSLLTGTDAPALLRRAWVEEADAELLRGGARGAPLGFDGLRSEIADFLDDSEEHPTDQHSRLEQALTLQVGLTSLLGFTVELDTLGDYGSTLTYADWAEFELGPGLDVEALFAPEGGSVVDAILASAAHPATFAPTELDRSDSRDEFEEKGITNFPEHGRLWYTDGGLVESKPVGRVIRAAHARGGHNPRDRRLHLVVDPRSSGPSAHQPWGERPEDPSWLDGLSRSISIVPTQALHDDIRRVVSINEKLVRLDEICERRADDDDDRKALRDELADAFGLAGKERVDIEMISPLLLTDDDKEISDLLAGDIIGAFGGFLSRRIRTSDFRLGWKCTVAWVEQDLHDNGCTAEDVKAVLDALDDTEDSDDVLLEGDSTDELGTRERWQLTVIAANAGLSLAREAIPIHRPRLANIPLLSRLGANGESGNGSGD